MKKVLNVCSVLCGITALLSLIMGIRVLATGGSFLIGLRIFGMAERGTFAGFIGNLLGIAISCLLTGICLISMIASIIGRSFSIGDLFIVALPAVYTYAVLRTA